MLTKRAPFSFTWGFTISDSVTLHSCTAVGITTGREPTMNDPNVQPSPPYTIIAYPENGIPIVNPLGDGTASMNWVPQLAAGTKVILSVVDSLGNSGGVSRNSYIVGSGPAGCVPSNNPNLKLTITSSGNSLQTCDTLPIRIEGGTKPYVVSVTSTDSDSTFNTTLDASNDYFQWINKASPGEELIVSVSDRTGQYAASSQIFTTAGSTDKSCPGKQDSQSVFGGVRSTSSSGSSRTTSSSSNTATSSPDNQPTKSSKNPTGAIIGTIVVILVIFGIIAYFFFRRRNQRHFGNQGSGGGGFGLMEYKKGGNLPGNDSFIPLKDHDASPSAPKMPLYGGDQLTPSTATNPGGFNGSRNRQSGYDYYSNPPSTFSGSNTLVPNAGQPSPLAAPAVGLGVGVAATRPSPAQQSKHQMMLEDRQRQQQMLQQQQHGWPTATAPPSVYPPVSSYTVNPVNPFGDNIYPYNPSAVGSSAPPSSVGGSAYGHNPTRSAGGDIAYGHNPTRSTGGDAAYGAPQQVSSTGTPIASDSQGAPVLTPAERAKAAEAAQERRAGYDDDDDPIPYMQQNRVVLGVTNPDRQSVATTNTTASDAYGGVASAGPQFVQHEDAGAVIELPPAYREFSKTPGPGM